MVVRPVSLGLRLELEVWVGKVLAKADGPVRSTRVMIWIFIAFSLRWPFPFERLDSPFHWFDRSAVSNLRVTFIFVAQQ